MRALCDAPYVVAMSLSALSLACLASLSQPDLQQQRDRPGRQVHEFVALGGGEAGEGLFEPFDRGQANGGYGLFAFFGEHGFHDAPVFGVAALRHEPLLLKVRHSAGHVLF